jgi:hypothetical protein
LKKPPGSTIIWFRLIAFEERPPILPELPALIAQHYNFGPAARSFNCGRGGHTPQFVPGNTESPHGRRFLHAAMRLFISALILQTSRRPDPLAIGNTFSRMLSTFVPSLSISSVRSETLIVLSTVVRPIKAAPLNRRYAFADDDPGGASIIRPSFSEQKPNHIPNSHFEYSADYAALFSTAQAERTTPFAASSRTLVQHFSGCHILSPDKTGIHKSQRSKFREI